MQFPVTGRNAVCFKGSTGYLKRDSLMVKRFRNMMLTIEQTIDLILQGMSKIYIITKFSYLNLYLMSSFKSSSHIELLINTLLPSISSFALLRIFSHSS